VLGLVLGGGIAAWIVPRLANGAQSSSPRVSAGDSQTAPTATAEVKVAAVGDMACDPTSQLADPESSVCRQDAVSDAVLADNPSLLMALGDLQYEAGAQGQWGPYTTSYGRLRAITRPVPGNHEYNTLGANGYFAYFPEWAGPNGDGYYSFDVGSWHVVALNSECADVGGCGTGSPQFTWLQQDLEQHRTVCTLAFWHIPRFSSGEHGDHTAYQKLWQTLADHGADLVLSGHDHNYERFTKLDADGQPDDRTGLRSFVVGTGGRNLRVAKSPRAGSEKIIDNALGFLELRLRPDSYSWRFLTMDGVVLDGGADRCH
jgi:hypothetical protein